MKRKIGSTKNGWIGTRAGHCKNRAQHSRKKTRGGEDFNAIALDRECLKYRCPAAAKGVACTQRDLCNGGCHTEHGRIVRIPLETNRRTFTPQARDSNTWDREYKHRSAIERVNSRIAGSFGFERHFIRGIKKMRARTGLALVVMLAVAVGRIHANQSDHLRSLVTPAAA